MADPPQVITDAIDVAVAKIRARADQGIAEAVAAERQRIIALAEELKFTLWRPSLDGPGGTDLALDVVPLGDLLQRLRKEDHHDA